MTFEARHELGRCAESWVADHLQDLGWHLVGKNLRTPFAEVDLLAYPPQQEALVLVEVKARASPSWGEAEEQLGLRQRLRLARALEWSALQLRWAGDLRADLAVLHYHRERLLHFEHLTDVDLYSA